MTLRYVHTLALSLFALVAFFPTRGASQSFDATELTGKWFGPATFFDKELAARVGALSFTAEFTADGLGTGRIGEAAFKVTRTQSTRGHVEFRATLTGAIAPDRALAKDYLVLVVTAVTDSTMQAEFHLKSNLTYDPRMREGRVALTRVRATP